MSKVDGKFFVRCSAILTGGVLICTKLVLIYDDQ